MGCRDPSPFQTSIPASSDHNLRHRRQTASRKAAEGNTTSTTPESPPLTELTSAHAHSFPQCRLSTTTQGPVCSVVCRMSHCCQFSWPVPRYCPLLVYLGHHIARGQNQDCTEDRHFCSRSRPKPLSFTHVDLSIMTGVNYDSTISVPQVRSRPRRRWNDFILWRTSTRVKNEITLTCRQIRNHQSGRPTVLFLAR